MIAQHVLGKLGTGKAIEVTDATTNRTFLVKVILAVTLGTNVLIKRSASFATVEFAQDLNLAKLTEVTVKTALARGCLGVDLGIKLLYCKLAVGVASKKADECFRNCRRTQCSDDIC